MADAHTPGPWRVARADEAPEHGLIVVDHEGGSVGDFMPAGPWMSIEQARANCRLAAAAPDLAAELQNQRERWEYFLDPALSFSPAIQAHAAISIRQIDAAIAKAVQP